MKKILYLCPNGYIGGAERFVLEAASGHLKFGKMKPTILFFNNGLAVEEAKARGIKTYLLKNSFRLSRPLSVFKAVQEVHSYLKEQNFDLYNATMPYAQIIGALAATGLKIKRTWYQHGPVGGVLDSLASFFQVDQVYFNSLYTLNDHYRTPLFNRGLFPDVVIPIGIPPKDVSDESVLAIRKEYLGEDQKGKLFVVAGRVSPWKGFETAIKAFKSVQKTHQIENLKLLIIGNATQEKDKPYLHYLKELVEEKYQNSILFLGRKSNLSDYMKAADIFLHTSKIPEPFGLVIAEAMKQGTFVIGTSRGGATDILINNQTGLTYDSTSEKADKELQKVIHRALQIDYRQMALAGKSLIDEQFSIENMTSMLEMEFEKVMSHEQQ